MNVTEIADTKAWVHKQLEYVNKGIEAALAGEEAPVAPQKPVIAVEPQPEPTHKWGRAWKAATTVVGPRVAQLTAVASHAASAAATQIGAFVGPGANAAMSEAHKLYTAAFEGAMATLDELVVAHLAGFNGAEFSEAVDAARLRLGILSEEAELRYDTEQAEKATKAVAERKAALDLRKAVAGLAVASGLTQEAQPQTNPTEAV